LTGRSVARPAALVLSLALGCATATSPSVAPAAPPAPAGPPDTVARLLTGRFDSADQARSSPGFTAVQVVACRADVPSLGPRALLVEQTRMDAPDTPERQRVYVLEPAAPGDGGAVARVFDLAVPGSSVGACALAVPPRFSREELVERLGCTLVFRRDGTVWRAATGGRGCPGAGGGATYATTELVLDALGFRWWERGFDAGGVQRSGPASGPAVFVRRTPLAPP
jgi:hypothetical protein